MTTTPRPDLLTDLLESPESLADYARAAFREALDGRHPAPATAAAARGVLALMLADTLPTFRLAEDAEPGPCCKDDDPDPTPPDDSEGESFSDLLLRAARDGGLLADGPRRLVIDPALSSLPTGTFGIVGGFDAAAWSLPDDPAPTIRLPFPALADTRFPAVEFETLDTEDPNVKRVRATSRFLVDVREDTTLLPGTFRLVRNGDTYTALAGAPWPQPAQEAPAPGTVTLPVEDVRRLLTVSRNAWAESVRDGHRVPQDAMALDVRVADALDAVERGD